VWEENLHRQDAKEDKVSMRQSHASFASFFSWRPWRLGGKKQKIEEIRLSRSL